VPKIELIHQLVLVNIIGLTTLLNVKNVLINVQPVFIMVKLITRTLVLIVLVALLIESIYHSVFVQLDIMMNKILIVNNVHLHVLLVLPTLPVKNVNQDSSYMKNSVLLNVH